jgi:hypothetical protein
MACKWDMQNRPFLFILLYCYRMLHFGIFNQWIVPRGLDLWGNNPGRPDLGSACRIPWHKSEVELRLITVIQHMREKRTRGRPCMLNHVKEGLDLYGYKFRLPVFQGSSVTGVRAEI